MRREQDGDIHRGFFMHSTGLFPEVLLLAEPSARSEKIERNGNNHSESGQPLQCVWGGRRAAGGTQLWRAQPTAPVVPSSVRPRANPGDLKGAQEWPMNMGGGSCCFGGNKQKSCSSFSRLLFPSALFFLELFFFPLQ